jgi:hypothetical protein
MTFTKERCLKPMAVGGGAPPHGRGGRCPLPTEVGGGQPRPMPSGPSLASPGPHLRPQATGQRVVAPRVKQPRIIALWAAPMTGGEGVGGAGACNLVATPPLPPKLALSHFWTGPPNFGANVIFIARPAQRLKKSLGQYNFFFYNSKLNFNFFPSKVLHWPTFL